VKLVTSKRSKQAKEEKSISVLECFGREDTGVGTRRKDKGEKERGKGGVKW